MADIRERIIIESVDNTTRGMRSAQNKLNAFDRTLKRVQTTMLGFVGINMFVHLVQGVVRTSDAAVELDAKLKLMTESTEEYNYAQQELLKLSLESGSSLEANTVLFTRMVKPIKQMGGSTQTAIDTTRALSQALRISGASTQESASVIRQWSQAMASGVLRGEEFNAVSENGQRVIQAISESLGVTIGELRAMSKEGVLTSRIVTEALLKQSKAIADENAKLPLTIGRALENIKTKYLQSMQSLSNVNSNIAEGINIIALKFDTLIASAARMLNVGELLIGLKLAKMFVANSVEIGKQVIAQRESVKAHALELQVIKDKELVEQQVRIRKTGFAVKEAATDLARANRSVNEVKNLIIQNELSIVRLENEIILQKAVIAGIKNDKAKTATLLTLTQLTARLNNLQREGALNTRALTRAQAELTVAYNVQSGAIRSNTAATAANTVASLGFFAKVAGKAKVLFGWLGKIGSAFLGLPGLIGYVAFEIASQFVPVEVMLAKLIQQLEYLGATAQYIWRNIKSLGATDASLSQYYKQLEKIDAKYLGALDKIIEGEANKRSQYKLTNDIVIQTSAEQLQISLKVEKEKQDNLRTSIDRETALRKLSLRSSIDGLAEYESAVKTLEQESAIRKEQVIIDGNEKQLGHLLSFYDRKAEVQRQAETVLGEQTDTQLRESFNNRQGLIVEYHDLEHDLIANHNALIRNLSTEQATAMKSIANNSVDALIKIANKHLNNELKAKSKATDILKDYTDFVEKSSGDQRLSYQKLADNQTLQRKVEQDLNKASKLEAEGRHKEAEKLRSESYESAKKVVTNYEDIASSAKEGSLSQVKASGSVQNAMELLKTATDDVITSNKALEQSAKSEREAVLQHVNQLKELIIQLDTQISKPRTIKPKVDTKTALNQLAIIDKKIKSLSQDVIVNVVTKKTGSDSDTVVKKADGGFIPRSNKVPGSGSGDKVKALLEPGEFIMRKAAVDQYGASTLYDMNAQRFNKGGIVQKFANGGLVSKSDKYLKNNFDKYTRLFDVWAKKSQRPGKGYQSLVRNSKASSVAAAILDIINSLKALKGKDYKTILKATSLNNKLFRSIRASATEYTGHGFKNLVRTSRDSSNRARIVRERDSIIEFDPNDLFQKFANGGSVLGSGLGDRVKALLTPGEFVIKKQAVQQFGSEFMNNINQGIAPKKFASGGLVGGNASNSDTINVNFNMNGSKATGYFNRNSATMNFIDELKKAEATV